VIDTHAHLDAVEDAAGALERARRAGVARVITVGTTIPSCRAALEMAEREAGVYAALGLHPHGAADAGAAEGDELRALLDHPAAVAVGETGLDYFRDYAPRARQRELFAAEAALAAKAEKTIVVHTRAADDDTRAVLEALPAAVNVVLHCFSAVGLLTPALERRWYVSFAGNVTYPKASDLRAAAREVPSDRLLVETDAPYLAPQPVRGRPNEPAHVVHTVAALAEARGEDAAELASQIDANAGRAFGLV